MKNFQISVKFGLITGIVLILYSVILYLTNANIFSPMVSITSMLVNFVFLIVMAVIAMNKTRDEVFGGKISYLNALLAGFILMIVSAILERFTTMFFPQPSIRAIFRDSCQISSTAWRVKSLKTLSIK